MLHIFPALSRVRNFCHDCKWKSGGNSWLPETQCQLFQVSGETNLKFRAESFSILASHDSLSKVYITKQGWRGMALPINGCILGRWTIHFEPFIAFTVQKFNTIFQIHFHYWWKEWYCQKNFHKFKNQHWGFESIVCHLHFWFHQ